MLPPLPGVVHEVNRHQELRLPASALVVLMDSECIPSCSTMSTEKDKTRRHRVEGYCPNRRLAGVVLTPLTRADIPYATSRTWEVRRPS